MQTKPTTTHKIPTYLLVLVAKIGRIRIQIKVQPLLFDTRFFQCIHIHLFYAVLFQLSNTYFEAIPFLGLKHKVDPVSGNSRTCKKDRNRNKIYLSMVCFILEVYPSDIEILSYGKPILSHQELLSMVDIPFQ